MNRTERLAGAIHEYLDDGQLKEFLNDLKEALKTERAAFQEKASWYDDALKELF